MPQTATNPETGERLYLVGENWIPFTETATNPDTGEQLALIGEDWLPFTSPNPSKSKAIPEESSSSPLEFLKGFIPFRGAFEDRPETQPIQGLIKDLGLGAIEGTANLGAGMQRLISQPADIGLRQAGLEGLADRAQTQQDSGMDFVKDIIGEPEDSGPNRMAREIGKTVPIIAAGSAGGSAPLAAQSAVFGTLGALQAAGEGEDAGGIASQAALDAALPVAAHALFKGVATLGRGLSGMVKGGEGTAADTILDVANIPRSLMASGDLSAPLRQGLLLTAGHPIKAAKATAKSLKHAFNKSSFDDFAESIASDLDYRLAKKAGLHLPTARMAEKGTLAGAEEVFRSEIAERLPVLGSIVRGSERAYIGYLDQMRWSTFKDGLKILKKGVTEVSEKETRDLAKWLNIASGRGDASGNLAKTIDASGQFFFSPRLLLSRVQALNPLTYMRLSGVARKEAVRDLMSTIGFIGGGMAVGVASGAKIETDSRSANFGQLRYGKTRVDLSGGFRPLLNFFSRIVTGETKNRVGEIAPARSTLGRFAQGKLNPAWGLVAELYTGKDFIGQDLKWDVKGDSIEEWMDDFSKTKEFELFTGMFANDVIEVARESGPLHAAVTAPLAALGATVSAYDSPEEARFSQFMDKKTNAALRKAGLNKKIEPSRVERSAGLGLGAILLWASTVALSKGKIKPSAGAASPLKKFLSEKQGPNLATASPSPEVATNFKEITALAKKAGFKPGSKVFFLLDEAGKPVSVLKPAQVGPAEQQGLNVTWFRIGQQ